MSDYIRMILKIPKTVKLYFFTELFMGLGFGIWGLNMNFYLVSKGIDMAAIGRINAVSPLMAAAFSLFSGYFCDKYGYRKMMFTGSIIKIFTMIVTIFTGRLELLFAARAINGIGDSFILTSTYPYVLSMVHEKDKNNVYCLLFSCSLFSVFAGNVAGGFAGGFFNDGMRYVYTLLIGTGIISIAAYLRFLLPDGGSRPEGKKAGLYIPKMKFVIRFLIFDFFGYISYFLAYSMLNLICRDIMRLTEPETGLILGLSIVMSSISNFFVPPLVARHSRHNVTSTVLIILAATYIAMAFSRGFLFGFLAIVSTMLTTMIVGLLDGPVLKKIPDSEKGGYSGLKVLLTSAATSIGIAAAGGMLNVAGGCTIIYLSVFALIVIQIAIYLFGFRRDICD
jgi:predicted MFS family arabinose efflux permease